MVKLTNVLILASGLAVTAFSLEKASNARFSPKGSLALSKHQQQIPSASVHSAPTFLKAEGSSEIVAKVETAPVVKKTLLETVWNPQTQLVLYMAVWYLGNIYCTFNSIAYILIFLNILLIFDFNGLRVQ